MNIAHASVSAAGIERLLRTSQQFIKCSATNALSKALHSVVILLSK